MDALEAVVAPIVATFGLELIDLERNASLLRITVDADGGAELDVIAKATRAISDRLDELDISEHRYTLEVSSPGVERRLRTPAHYARSIGEDVSIKMAPGTGELRRLDGKLVAADATTATILTDAGTEVRVAIDDVDRCKTVFTWGATAQPSPSKGKPKPKTAPPSEPASEERAPTR